MVVEHRLNVLEPLELGSCLVIVEDTGIEHETGHHQSADGKRHQLGLIGDAPCTPDVKEARSDLNALETGTHITVENLLAKHGPHHLSTWLHVGGIGEPAGEVGEAGSVEEGAA